jgi:hypothetical protein
MATSVLDSYFFYHKVPCETFIDFMTRYSFKIVMTHINRFIFAGKFYNYLFIYDYLFKVRLIGLSLSTKTSHGLFYCRLRVCVCVCVCVCLCVKESDKSKVPIRSF